MLLIEKETSVPPWKGNDSIFAHFEQSIQAHLTDNEIPVRFVVTQSDLTGYLCELGVLSEFHHLPVQKPRSIFDFAPRKIENRDKFNVVMIVPTGIGAEIGGHSGDAAPAARLLAGACDTLITHPNVVNASDINELPENCLYIEGSVISQLIMGTVGLAKVRSNRIMLIIDKHTDSRISDFAINAASAARASIGVDCPIVMEMNPSVRMQSSYSKSGRAVGRIESVERLCDVILKNRSEYDAIALTSVINVPNEFHVGYYKHHGEIINPWGGVEAMLTHAVTMLFGVPTAHSPMLDSIDIVNLQVGVVDPRMAAEVISSSFLISILKGLHRSPRIITDKMLFTHPGVLTVDDISCIVIPDGCIGLPTLAALEQGIPIIAVRENRNCMKNDLSKLPFSPGKLFIVDNYLEAVGIMIALKSGISPAAVRRPIEDTKVLSC
ncbi:MAG: DUF3326 domain-containing protein [Candidatus Aminicenantes bacterium]|nr:DUF3326 domain-containing protein [Candidatus Aminicenantes bacterium]